MKVNFKFPWVFFKMGPKKKPKKKTYFRIEVGDLRLNLKLPTLCWSTHSSDGPFRHWSNCSDQHREWPWVLKNKVKIRFLVGNFCAHVGKRVNNSHPIDFSCNPPIFSVVRHLEFFSVFAPFWKRPTLWRFIFFDMGYYFKKEYF